jgi:hypothetical protein
MTVGSHRMDLRVWLLVSLAAHSLLLATPHRVIETLFPAKPRPAESRPGDLTADFGQRALRVINIALEEVKAVAEVVPVEATEETVPGPLPGPAGPTEVAATPSGGSAYGLDQGGGDTRFFPPVPRLIVPPDLRDLGIAHVSVSMRILVGVDGRPVSIEIPDTLASREVRRLLRESAASFRFEPARMGQMPVEAWVDLPLELRASRSP